MLLSMTGYGRGESESGSRLAVVETRSVNHRFLDISVKSSSRIFQLDERVRRAVKERFSRGSFDIFVSITAEESGVEVTVNEELARRFMAAVEKLAERYGMVYPPTIGDLLLVKDAIQVSEPQWGLDDVWPVVHEALTSALDRLEEMRKAEGAHIRDDLAGRLGLLDELSARITEEARTGSGERFGSLKEKIARLVEDVSIDESRLAQEAAILADRSDVTEELTRLQSHFRQAGKLMEEGGEVGRKLDFLIQEMHRETNTIGSKTTSVEVTNLVVDVKSELEKIREQAQNLE